MKEQEEFRELELALKNMPNKKLEPRSFQAIHHNLLQEADRLERRGSQLEVFKKSMWGVSSLAALFLLFFFGLSLVGTNESVQQESGKAGGDSKGAAFDRDENSVPTTIQLSLDLVVEHLRIAGLEPSRKEPDSRNVFQKNLIGVSPAVYGLSQGEISVYVFQDELEVQAGIEEFNDSTATMDLIGYEIYQARNVLIFHTGGNAERLEHAIEQMNR